MDNLDFEIEIDARSGSGYPVAVLHSPAGEVRSTMSFPFDELALQNRLVTLQLALLSSGRGRRRVVPEQEVEVREFGTALYDALFADPVGRLLDASRQQARSEGLGLRIKLRCRAPELAALPWEFLFDREADEYLCLSRYTPLVRYLEVPARMDPLRVEPPLRVLAVVANPEGTSTLDVAQEKERIDTALEPLQRDGLVEVQWLPAPTWRELQRALNRGRWHVFHFIGHGGFDPATQEGVLAFENDDGTMHKLGASELGLLLGDHQDLRLAVLNSCEGARSNAIDVFSSSAAVLVRRGTPGVVAMQYEITDLAAIELARSFYESIATGLPVDTALSEARKAVRLSLPGTLEWGTPVLFMRAPDGVLFDVIAPPARSTPVDALEEAPLEPAPMDPKPIKDVETVAPDQALPPSPKRGSPMKRLGALSGSQRLIAGALALALVVSLVAFVATRDDEPTVSAGPAGLRDPRSVALGPDGTVVVADAGNNRVIAVMPNGQIRHVAGAPEGDGSDAEDGLAEAIQLSYPAAVAVAPDGTIYISEHGRNLIRSVTGPRLATIHPEPGGSVNVSATAMAFGAGALFIATNDNVYSLGPDRALRDVAGTGVKGFDESTTKATEARLDNVEGIAVSPEGIVYIADSQNRRVRRVTSDGIIQTIAGNGGNQYLVDGQQATAGALNYPIDVGLDGEGNLYVLDTSRAVFRLDQSGKVKIIVPPSEENGFAGDGGPVENALFGAAPENFAVAPDGTLYLLDQGNNRVRQVTPDGTISTIA